MSTKNLARTVIEGGRASYNKWERRHSTAQERHRERMVSSRLLSSSELDDVIYPMRRRVYRGFSDKLSPAERWLESQVGRPWNKVRSELFTRFDSRTTAGRHILFCHLLNSVSVSGDYLGFFSHFEFTVDAHGILRRKLSRARQRRTYPRLPEDSEVLEAWIGGRRVGERSPHLYWFVQTPAGAFRQHRLLIDAEVARWRSLPAWFRERYDTFKAPSAEKTG